MLSVTTQFQPSDVEAIGGTCHWRWPEAGIAVASSTSATFDVDAESADGPENIRWAAPDLVIPQRALRIGVSMTREQLREAEAQAAALVPADYSPPKAQSFGLGTGSFPVADGPDVYAINGQWALYAIGAARPKEIDPVYSTPVHAGPGPKKPLFKTHYTPEWLLDQIDGHDYAGSGVTIAFVDSGIPAVWLDGFERTVPVLDENGDQLLDVDGNPVFVHDCELHPEFDWFDPSRPEEGGIVPPGYDAGMPDWLRLDRFDDWEGHGTGVTGLLAAKYSKRVHGAMRGLAPKAKYYCYNWSDYRYPSVDEFSFVVLSKMLRAWKRAPDDGVQILNNSWSWSSILRATSEKWGERYELLARNAANGLSRRGVLVVACAGNESTLFERDHGFPRFLHTFPQEASNVLTVAGTAPRDYWPIQFAWEPKFDLSLYLPDAPDRPYDPLNRALNLDRPMLIYYWPPFVEVPTFYGGTNFGAAIDLAAPAGSEDDRAAFDPNDPEWPAFEVFRSTNNLIYTTFPLPNAIFAIPPFPPAFDYGFHSIWSGTSFAAPYTCGVAALAAESYKRTTGEWPSVATLRQIVIRSADDLVGPYTEDQPVYDPDYHEDPDYPCEKVGHDPFYGFGRVNALRAILEAKGG